MVRELHRPASKSFSMCLQSHREGGRDGPVLQFSGLDNDVYYLLTPDGSGYLDYTGCGKHLELATTRWCVP